MQSKTITMYCNIKALPTFAYSPAPEEVDGQQYQRHDRQSGQHTRCSHHSDAGLTLSPGRNCRGQDEQTQGQHPERHPGRLKSSQKASRYRSQRCQR